MSSAIEVNDIVVVYPNGTKAVSGLSFEVGWSEVVALIGPNGAGKTTTLKVIAGLLRPTSGIVYVDGIPTVDEGGFLKVKRSMAFVLQENAFDYFLPLWDNIDIYLKLYGFPRGERKRIIADVLKEFGLWEYRKEPVERLSGGLRRRAQLARAFAVDPSILILDEPTVGLDPRSRRGFWEIVRRFVREGKKAVLWTSHYLDEVEENSDRVVMISRGRKVLEGSPRDIKRAFLEDLLIIEFEDENLTVRALGIIEGAKPLSNTLIALPLKGGKLLEVVRKLAESKVMPVSIRRGVKDLEDIYLEVVK